MRIPNNTFRLCLIIFSIILVGCGTIQVDLLPAPTNTPGSASQAAAPTMTEAPTAIPIPTQTPQPVSATKPGVPDLVLMGPHAPFGYSELGHMVYQTGEFSLQHEPYYELFWDYSPQTGRLAYSSVFFHASESGSISVSDLWVYDFETGTSEQWLADGVARAVWAPGGEQLTVALYNPKTTVLDLALVSGPDQVKIIAECASHLFSWSPRGDAIAFVHNINWAGMQPACAGTYLIDFPAGIQEDGVITRISDLGSFELISGAQNDQPLWALEQNALIYPDAPFWVIPLDGSPAFTPQIASGEDPMEIPRPFGNLWAADLRQMIGQYDSGMSGWGGVWVYQFSEDLSIITDYYRIGATPNSGNLDTHLMGWWTPGESLLVLEPDMVASPDFLDEYWGAPAAWSLTQRAWVNLK
jgi:hypothetical protein